MCFQNFLRKSRLPNYGGDACLKQWEVSYGASDLKTGWLYNSDMKLKVDKYSIN